MSRLSIDTECRRTDLSSVQSEFDGQVPAEAQYSSMQDRLSVLWSFLSTFRSTNLHLVSENELFGGESAIAEGSTYVVDKRLMSTVDGLKTVAVKRLKRDFGKSIGGSAGGLTRTDVLNIVNDVRTMAQEPLASHPHIVQFLGYGWIERAGGISVFQAVEFSPFGSLKAMLREHSFSLDAKFDICHQVATGLNALHTTRVAHGDVKLENILVFDPFFQRPFPYILKISDFGSSVHDVDGRYTGTYLLNAPEVRDGTVNVKQEGETVEKFLRCDTYSFGILTWEVLLGGEGFSISAGREDRSEWLNESPPSGIIRISPYSVHALTSGNELIQSLFNAILESALASRPKDRMTMKRIKLLFDSYYFGIPEHEIRNLQDDSDFIVDSLLEFQLWKEDSHGFDRFKNTCLRPLEIQLPLNNEPWSIQTAIFNATSKIAFGDETKNSHDAADRLARAFSTNFGVKSDLENVLATLQKLVHLGRGTTVDITYHRLLHALGYRLPEGLPDEREYSNLSLERKLSDMPVAECSGARLLEYRKKTRQLVATTGFISFQHLKVELDTDGRVILNEAFWESSKDEKPWLQPNFIAWLAATGSVTSLEAIRQRHPDVGIQRNEKDISPIMAASMQGQLGTVQYLIRRCALQLVNHMAESPLHWLVKFDREDVDEACTTFLRGGCNINAFVPRADAISLPEREEVILWGSPLQWAIACNRKDVVKVLLKYGADINFDGGVQFWSPIHCAVYHHSVDMLRLLFQQNARRDLDFSPFRKLATGIPLQRILTHAHLREFMMKETVDELIKQGFDIHDRYELGVSGERQEHWILERIMKDDAFFENFTLVETLLQKGAKMRTDVRAIRDCLKYHPPGPQGRLAAFLQKKGLICESSRPEEPKILHILAADGLFDAADSLLQSSIAVDSVFEAGSLGLPTPLIASVCWHPSREFVETLLTHGADVNHRCGCRIPGIWDTPLGLSIGWGTANGQVIDLLLDKGAGTELNGSNIVYHVTALSAEVDGRHVLEHLLRRRGDNLLRHPQLARYINMTCNGQLPTIAAARRLNIGAVHALLNAGALMNGCGDIVIESLKSHAIQSYFPEDFDFSEWEGKLGTVKDLVLKVLTRVTDALESEGLLLRCSKLHWAAAIGSLSLIERILNQTEEAAAELWARNVIDLLPLHMVLPRAPRGLQWSPEQIRYLGAQKRTIALYLIDKMLSTPPDDTSSTQAELSGLRIVREDISRRETLSIPQTDEEDRLNLDVTLYSTMYENRDQAQGNDQQRNEDTDISGIAERSDSAEVRSSYTRDILLGPQHACSSNDRYWASSPSRGKPRPLCGCLCF